VGARGLSRHPVALTLLGVVTLFDRPCGIPCSGWGASLCWGTRVDAFRAGVTPPNLETLTPTGHPFLVGFGIGIANADHAAMVSDRGRGPHCRARRRPNGRARVAFGTSFVIGVLLLGYGGRRPAERAGAGWGRARCACSTPSRLVFFGFALRLAWKFLQTYR